MQIMRVDIIRIMVYYWLVKKFITDLERIKKIMFLLTFENFNLIIYILNQKFTSIQNFRVQTATNSYPIETIN